MKSSELFADVSSNDGPVNIINYSRAGHVLIAIKATQGRDYVNPFHDHQANVAHELGLTVVHYHYCDSSSPQLQLEHFRGNYIRTWRNGDYGCFDIEEPYLNLDFANDILNKYVRQTTHEPVLYTYDDDFKNKLHGVNVPGGRVWIANYSNNPIQLPKWYKLWGRQYTDGQYGPEPHFYSGIGKCDGSYLSAGVAKALYIRKLRTRKKK